MSCTQMPCSTSRLDYNLLTPMHVPQQDPSPSGAGGFEREAFVSSMSLLFAPGSEYALALEARLAAYDPAK